MATTTEAPASSTAEGPTTHTQNQTPRFSPYQLRMLHGGINPARVRTLGKLSHLEAWDVRRQLTRIFGFGGYSIETLSLDLVHENRQDNFQKRNKQGEPYGNTYTAWTIVYRAQVRLTVFDTNGQEICHWEDGAAGDATNQPSVGDAHDMAMKTSLSQALKRCAVNLGDQFGLSLYDGGSRDAVVNFSAAHPPSEWKQQPPPEPEPVDPPVRPEPTAHQDDEDNAPAPAVAPTASASQSGTAATGRDYLNEAHSAPHAEAVRAIYRDAKNDGAVPEYLAQIAHVGQAKASQPAAAPASDGPDPIDHLMSQAIRNFADHLELTKVLAEAGRRNQMLREVDGPAGGTVPFGEMVTARIAELKEQARQAELNGHNPERGAA
ncbi:Rad52/Rad22 family DNA repair protein [Streptomyces sp. NBC_01422]|uniref:Rad52/Rad22 family DNA repair protein n=1 Tax=Streptomyces sp. NBC_01422 TaxID=2903859 RepID=UPI002E2E814C|nr:Rad52/Rad22 family DNA repair protein [Streptomyces sp. NBC_01422]